MVAVKKKPRLKKPRLGKRLNNGNDSQPVSLCFPVREQRIRWVDARQPDPALFRGWADRPAA